jgi:glycerol uptake facilitator-like aquaporin
MMIDYALCAFVRYGPAELLKHRNPLNIWEATMKKPIAEFVGTFTLVFFGCGAAVIAGMGAGPTSIDILGIAFAFGLAIVAIAYGIGPISGCHVNPAVSLGVLVAGRMTTSDFISYVIAQVLGAIAGAIVLYIILSGKSEGWTGGLGQNGWGPAISVNTICFQPLSSRSSRPSSSWSVFSE